MRDEPYSSFRGALKDLAELIGSHAIVLTIPEEVPEAISDIIRACTARGAT